MQLSHRWLAFLGAVCVTLLPTVLADDQISDPNLPVIRQFNIVLTDNTKVSDLSCCMGLSNEIPSVGQYKCSPSQAMQMSDAPGSRRLGLQFCHHLPGSTPDDASGAFKAACSAGQGELITPDKGYCPQVWPNYDEKYVKPAPPAPAADPAPAPAPAPAATPDKDGKGTNDPAGFKDKGTFHYTLVDYALTRALACCKAATSPLVKPNKYKCAQRKATRKVFMQQCAKVLPTITKGKKLKGYSTIDGDGGEIVDDETKKTCSGMWTNAVSYTYGFCQLDYDGARDEARKAFGEDCQAKGGESKEPHDGMCLWNVDDAADDSSN